MGERLIQPNSIRNIFDLTAYLEYKYGNLNYYFKSVFEGIFDYEQLYEIIYLFDKLNGDTSCSLEEYKYVHKDISLEQMLEKLKLVCKNIYHATKDKNYKPNFSRGLYE